MVTVRERLEYFGTGRKQHRFVLPLDVPKGGRLAVPTGRGYALGHVYRIYQVEEDIPAQVFAERPWQGVRFVGPMLMPREVFLPELNWSQGGN